MSKVSSSALTALGTALFKQVVHDLREGGALREDALEFVMGPDLENWVAGLPALREFETDDVRSTLLRRGRVPLEEARRYAA